MGWDVPAANLSAVAAVLRIPSLAATSLIASSLLTAMLPTVAGRRGERGRTNHK